MSVLMLLNRKNRKMKLTLEIDHNKNSPTMVGELLMLVLNPHKRWGYMTNDFSCRAQEQEVSIETDLLEATLCCGSLAKIEYDKISKYFLPEHNLYVYLFWDGDGVIIFKHKEEGWILYNTDIKCERDWEWCDKDC